MNPNSNPTSKWIWDWAQTSKLNLSQFNGKMKPVVQVPHLVVKNRVIIIDDYLMNNLKI